MIQVALAGSQYHVVHSRLYLLSKRSVASHAEFQVGAIVTHHIHLCSSQFVAILLVHPTLYGLYNLWVEEAVNMVESS